MRAFLIILSFLSAYAYAHNIAPKDQQELKKLTLDYTKWNGTGVPEDFWKKLDIQSREETRKLIIEAMMLYHELKLPKRFDWDRMWKEKGIENIQEKLPKLKSEEFWEFYHKKPKRTHADESYYDGNKVEIEVKSLAIEGITAYIAYQIIHTGIREGSDEVRILTAIKRDGEWKLLPQHGISGHFRAEVADMKKMKKSNK